MTRIYMDVDVIYNINGNLENHAGDVWTTISLIRDLANFTSDSNGWWQGTAGESFGQSVRNWANDFEKWLEKYNILKTQLKNEWDEWGQADSSFSYDGEEIDSLAELLAWFSGGGKTNYTSGSTVFAVKIDLKKILLGDGFWYANYPPAATTVWRQDDSGRWYKVVITPADWNFDLTISTAGVSVDAGYTFYTVTATWDMGNGYIGGSELKIGEVGVSAGTGGVDVEASAVSAELEVGRNVGDAYIGAKFGGRLGAGVGVDDGSVDGGFIYGGGEIGEKKTVAPPGS
jgi:uncharacterized protein YukE